jgi:hypothetical protein
MSEKQEDFNKLYAKILEEYKDAFAIYFDTKDCPTDNCVYMYDKESWNELRPNFYIIKKSVIDTHFNLLKLAYYQYGDNEYGRFNYFSTRYEVLETVEFIDLDKVVGMIPSDCIDYQEIDNNDWVMKNDKGEIIDDGKNYTLISGGCYKISNLVVASDENKGLLLEAFARMMG